MEDRKERNAPWLSVPQFGDWDQKGPLPDYSMDFSKIREMRKQNKTRASLGNEEELINPTANLPKASHNNDNQPQQYHHSNHQQHSPTDFEINRLWYAAVDRVSAGNNSSDFCQHRSEAFHFKTISGHRTVVIEDYVTKRKRLVRISSDEPRRRRLIYLEVSQAVWLGKTLKDISQRGWESNSFHRRTEPSRAISVDRLACREGCFLKISERIPTGRVFSICIPFVPSEWGVLINRLNQQVTKSYPKKHIQRNAWLVQGKSYAEAVKQSFSLEEGKSAIKKHNSLPFLQVEENGVPDRLHFLDRCLSISFFDKKNQGLPSALSEEFMHWARRRWNLPEETSFSNRVGDLWFLVCTSLPEAIRVKEDGYAKFRQWNVILRYWKEEDGRCFAPQGGLQWVLVFGIPPFLRSADVFKNIGQLCGGFIDADHSAWSDPYVRIKIRPRGVLPEILPIRFGCTVFVAKIIPVPEIDRPMADLNRRRLLDQISRSCCARKLSNRERASCAANEATSSLQPSNASIPSVPSPGKKVEFSPAQQLKPGHASGIRKIWVRKYGPPTKPISHHPPSFCEPMDSEPFSIFETLPVGPASIGHPGLAPVLASSAPLPSPQPPSPCCEPSEPEPITTFETLPVGPSSSGRPDTLRFLSIPTPFVY
ncbi:unnamed protein product [Linum tenue]|uniref:RIN4 pathogenic type III effector avirulence factor Avr cleavage site domain-containing protein n=1 Tax=Linum tenue TaxID=586396 RepID=A0AAV0RE86_9ROSI|nr:unnamed protein product [Linum tenue]